MPMVTMAWAREAKSKASPRICWNFLASGMTWSAGRTAMTPVVERAPTSAAPRVTAAQVSRPTGSGTRLCLGSFGELFADFRQLRPVGDDKNVLGGHERQHALDSFLQKGLFAEQREQLLGQ